MPGAGGEEKKSCGRKRLCWNMKRTWGMESQLGQGHIDNETCTSDLSPEREEHTNCRHIDSVGWSNIFIKFNLSYKTLFYDYY